MTSTLMNYTTRAAVEAQLKRTFPEVTTDEFNRYLLASEAYINNYLGYNGETTTSGIMTEVVSREKHVGKLDIYGNLVVDVMHGPVHTDVNGNPLVTLLQYNVGTVNIVLNLTDGSNNAQNSFIELSENRRQVVYPSTFFLPAISSVTPSAKVNIFALQDVKFWVDISYTGGFDTVPADITLAANYICAEFLLQRDNPQFLTSFTQGSLTKQFQARSANKKGFAVGSSLELANALLQPYVRYTF